MNDLAQMIGLSPDGDWDDELELAERCHTDSCGHVMSEGCHHKPDCPHYCEDGHFSGDDLVMAEIGTGWPARWETALEQRDEAISALALLVSEADYWSYEWSDGKGRSWRFSEIQPSLQRALQAAREIVSSTDHRTLQIVRRDYFDSLQRTALGLSKKP